MHLRLKLRFYYLTPASISDGKGRAYSNCIGFTGLAMLDFDNLEPEFAVELKQFIFNSYPYVIASFLSVSKRGLKCIVRIPVVETIEEYKAVYYGLLAEFEQFKGCDSAHSNAVLASYITYDRDLLYRTSATVFNRRGIRLDEFKINTKEVEPLENVEQEDINGIKLMLKRMIAKVDVEQTGHILVRSASLMCGAYCGYGYMSEDEGRDYIFELIDQSDYLQKSLSTYKKTAVSMIRRGMTAPLKYDRNEDR